MALTRYKVGPRKVCIAIELAQEDGTVEPFADPAVDLEHSNLEEYQESHYDLQHLKFFDDVEPPTFFHVRQLTDRQRSYIDQLADSTKLRMAFRIGVTNVENWYHRDGDGEAVLMSHQVKRKNFSGMGDAITEGWLRKADFPSMIVNTVGAMVLRISEASSPLSRRSKDPSGEKS